MTRFKELELSQTVADIYIALEHDLMIEIAKQLAKDSYIDSTSEWRIKKLAQTGELSKKTIEIISSYARLQSDAVIKAIENAADITVSEWGTAFKQASDDGIVKNALQNVISMGVQQAVTHYTKQAKSDLNLVNTVMQYKAKQIYINIVNKTYDIVQGVPNAPNNQELLDIIGKHTMSVVTGAETRQKALRNCIKEMAQKGIPAFIDAAGREWSPESYINMDIKTTVSNTAHAVQDVYLDKHDIDLIEISSHMGARPKCEPYQGKLFSRSNKSGVTHDIHGKEIPFLPFSDTSYGKPDGLFGINCHHKKYPFVDGASYQTYLPYEKDENDKRYLEVQKQRALERKVRQCKNKIDTLKELGDKDGLKEAKTQLKLANNRYNAYCDGKGLPVRKDRLSVVKTSGNKLISKDRG